jgi:hypothetical protein
MSPNRRRAPGANSDARFERVQQLARDSRAAYQAHGAVYREKPNPDDDDACVRWEMTKFRLCRASVAAQDAYHKACDEFFLNAAERGQ